MSTEPAELEAPGGGLPPTEAFVARYILFPVSCWLMTPDKGVRLVCEVGHDCLEQAKSLPVEKLTERQLIRRFPGIEDSSRNWSVLMTLEHLCITGEGMAGIIEALAEGNPLDLEVRIEDVKPPEAVTPDEVFARYERFLGGYLQRMRPLLERDLRAHRHEHPWFGAITTHQWICLNGLHHQIHRKQIGAIMALL